MIKYIGALWKKEGTRGGYLSGEIELAEGQKLHINVYKNDRKTKDNQPDFSITTKVEDPKPVTDQPTVIETSPEDPFLL